jgi:hypothetical protein
MWHPVYDCGVQHRARRLRRRCHRCAREALCPCDVRAEITLVAWGRPDGWPRGASVEHAGQRHLVRAAYRRGPWLVRVVLDRATWWRRLLVWLRYKLPNGGSE